MAERPTEFEQIYAAIMTQNVLMAKLVRKMDTGKTPSDDDAFQYASVLYSEILRGRVRMP